MRVKVDGAKCNGYGLCEKLCPAVFKLDEFGFPQLLNEGLVPSTSQYEAEKAIEQCPEHAIARVE
jgi:ferredoxin